MHNPVFFFFFRFLGPCSTLALLHLGPFPFGPFFPSTSGPFLVQPFSMERKHTLEKRTFILEEVALGLT